jgi:hypothetical protein
MHGRDEKCIKILVLKPQVKRPLGKLRHTWEIIKVDLKVWTGFIWLGLETRDGLL